MNYEEFLQHLYTLAQRIDQVHPTNNHSAAHTSTLALSDGTDKNSHDHPGKTTGNEGTPTVTHLSDGTRQPNSSKSDEIGEETRGAPPPSTLSTCPHLVDVSNAFRYLPIASDNRLPYHQHYDHIPFHDHGDGLHHVALFTDHRTQIYTGHLPSGFSTRTTSMCTVPLYTLPQLAV